jgi:hypothetical protein
VIVHDFNVFSTCIGSTKTHAKLIVHTNALLPCTIAFQGFQPIAWRHPKIVQFFGDLELPQLTPRDGSDVHKPLSPLALRKRLRIWTLERPDHGCDSNELRD